MRTNLKLYFDSDGEKPSMVMDRLKRIGFKVSIGRFDLYHDWGKDVGEAEILGLGDKVSRTLRGTGATFILETNKYD